MKLILKQMVLKILDLTISLVLKITVDLKEPLFWLRNVLFLNIHKLNWDVLKYL